MAFSVETHHPLTHMYRTYQILMVRNLLDSPAVQGLICRRKEAFKTQNDTSLGISGDLLTYVSKMHKFLQTCQHLTVTSCAITVREALDK